MPAVAAAAARRGVLAGICDHLSPYHNIYYESAFEAYVREVRRTNLFLGAELCAGEAPPVAPERLRALDYYLIGVHNLTLGGKNYYFWGHELPEDAEAFVEEYIRAVAASLREFPADALAHPTYLPLPLMRFYDELWTDDRCARLWEAAARAGAAVEISGRWSVPRERPLRLALEMGLKFSYGSDAHRPEELFNVEFPLQQAESLRIPEDRIFLPARRGGKRDA